VYTLIVTGQVFATHSTVDLIRPRFCGLATHTTRSIHVPADFNNSSTYIHCTTKLRTTAGLSILSSECERTKSQNRIHVEIGITVYS
jgi:hypothetical protein